MINIDQYNILTISLLSTKLWDIVGLILQGILNAILWETRTYTSFAENTSEFYRILKKISDTYYFCSETRIQYETEFLMPTGLIIGPKYIAHIKHTFNDTYGGRSSVKIIIQLYGWFSISSIITGDVVGETRGKYKFIETGYSSEVYCYSENFPDEYFHPNTHIASKYIYDSVMKQHNNSGVYLLFGIPNTGKTTTAKCLYNYFDDTSVICPDLLSPPNGVYNLYSSFKYFYGKIKPEKNKFLIFVIDEVDELIHNIFVTKRADRYDIKYPSKQSWNFFLEKITTNKNVIVLLTTNKTKSYFDKLDNSLFRQHRLTEAYQFTENDVIPQPFPKISETETTNTEPETVQPTAEKTRIQKIWGSLRKLFSREKAQK